MSKTIKLIQRIRELSAQLETARNEHDEEFIEELEDELFELQEELDELNEQEYNSAHNKNWN